MSKETLETRMEKSTGDLIGEIAKRLNVDLSNIKDLDKKREILNKKESEMATRKVIHRRYSAMLKKDSLFNDPDLVNADFANFKTDVPEQQKNKELARQFAKEYIVGENPFNTIIFGEAGKGKSHLAISILKGVNDYMEQHNKLFSCLFIDVNSMMAKIMDYKFHDGNSKYSDYNMIKLCKRADLLVLDDLGTESNMKYNGDEANNITQRVLYSILNARNNTIITTNLSLNKMKETYNPKLISRIKRHIGNHVIIFTDKTKDMRQEGVKW